jgi:hypothetical protein
MNNVKSAIDTISSWLRFGTSTPTTPFSSLLEGEGEGESPYEMPLSGEIKKYKYDNAPQTSRKQCLGNWQFGGQYSHSLAGRWARNDNDAYKERCKNCQEELIQKISSLPYDQCKGECKKGEGECMPQGFSPITELKSLNCEGEKNSGSFLYELLSLPNPKGEGMYDGVICTLDLPKQSGKCGCQK